VNNLLFGFFFLRVLIVMVYVKHGLIFAVERRNGERRAKRQK